VSETETLSETETVHATYVPLWSFGDVRHVGRKEWLEGWQESGARPETMAIARAMTAKGFNHATGGQWHPKTASVIALDAGCSVASAKRFLRKGRQSGRLTPSGDIVTLVAGKRSTPLYVLTVPGRYFGRPFGEGIPEAARADLEAQVSWGAMAEAMAAGPHPWDVPNVLPCPF